MKKKRKKKFLLHRETLRRLDGDSLGLVAGGGGTFEVDTTCACTDGCDGGDTGGCGSGGCGGSDYTCTCIDPPSYCYCP